MPLPIETIDLSSSKSTIFCWYLEPCFDNITYFFRIRASLFSTLQRVGINLNPQLALTMIHGISYTIGGKISRN